MKGNIAAPGEVAQKDVFATPLSLWVLDFDPGHIMDFFACGSSAFRVLGCQGSTCDHTCVFVTSMAEYFSAPTDRVGASLSFLTWQLLFILSIWTAYAFRPWISHSLSCFEIELSGVGTSVALLGIALSSLLTHLVALQALCPLVLRRGYLGAISVGLILLGALSASLTCVLLRQVLKNRTSQVSVWSVMDLCAKAPAVLPAIADSSGNFRDTPEATTKRWQEYFSGLEDGIEVVRHDLVNSSSHNQPADWPVPLAALPAPVVRLRGIWKGDDAPDQAQHGQISPFFKMRAISFGITDWMGTEAAGRQRRVHSQTPLRGTRSSSPSAPGAAETLQEAKDNVKFTEAPPPLHRLPGWLGQKAVRGLRIAPATVGTIVGRLDDVE
ncbi:unnamed protein product, partial [Symbiodinium microadriaticum]